MATTSRSLNPGQLIGNKYLIVQPIGSGGMGIVYEALHTRLGQRVAVKMLLPDLAESAEAVARFEREARAAAHLRSSHVARVFDVDALPDGTPYIVMEFLEGRDLADELVERGPLPIAEAVDYVLQACDAMAEAHRLGIVHRDLKPSNLFLAEDGQQTMVKVLDFGISKVADSVSPSVTTTRTGLGTAIYMSPEQVRSAKNVDARTDVWALGVVLYELLAGCSPFEGDTSTAVAAAIVADPAHPLRDLRQEVSVELEAVVMTALDKNREHRFADAAALAAALIPFGPPRVERTARPMPTRTIRTSKNSATPLTSANTFDDRLTVRDPTLQVSPDEMNQMPGDPHAAVTSVGDPPTVRLDDLSSKDTVRQGAAPVPAITKPLGSASGAEAGSARVIPEPPGEIVIGEVVPSEAVDPIEDSAIEADLAPILITAKPAPSPATAQSGKKPAGTKGLAPRTITVLVALAALVVATTALIYEVSQGPAAPSASSAAATESAPSTTSASPPPQDIPPTALPTDFAAEPPAAPSAVAPSLAVSATARKGGTGAPRSLAAIAASASGSPSGSPRPGKPSKRSTPPSSGLPNDPG